MKSTCGLIFGVALLAAICGAAKDCTKIPTVKIHECCKMPELVETKIVVDIITAVNKEPGSDYFKLCKVKEGIFKKLELIKSDDLDMESVVKYLDNKVTDSDWKAVAKKSFEYCMKEMEPQLEEMQKRSNFTKAECNVKYDVMTECVDISSFEGCPKKSWTEKTECNDSKKFITDCHKNFEAMEKFADSQRNQ